MFISISLGDLLTNGGLGTGGEPDMGSAKEEDGPIMVSCKPPLWYTGEAGDTAAVEEDEEEDGPIMVSCKPPPCDGGGPGNVGDGGLVGFDIGLIVRVQQNLAPYPSLYTVFLQVAER